MKRKVTDLAHWITYTLQSYKLEKCPITGIEEATIEYFDKSGAHYVCTYYPDFDAPRFELVIGSKRVKI